jgi:hypothetical protein
MQPLSEFRMLFCGKLNGRRGSLIMRLATGPSFTGLPPIVNTTGIVVLAAQQGQALVIARQS